MIDPKLLAEWKKVAEGVHDRDCVPINLDADTWWFAFDITNLTQKEMKRFEQFYQTFKPSVVLGLLERLGAK